MSTRRSSGPARLNWKATFCEPFMRVPGPFKQSEPATRGRVEHLPASQHDPAGHSGGQACSCAESAGAAGSAHISKAANQGQRLLVLLFSVYKVFLSPLLPSSCKFYPTCSAYATEAVERHGAARGLGLALKRLLRCRPFSPGGYDPVPDA
jgi:putative membrane protein insertion efficiency factor